MASTEMAQVERVARRAYERSRWARAAWGSLPIVLLALAVSFVHARPLSAWAFGLGGAALGMVCLWYGRDAQRAVLPGMLTGLVPLVLATAANQVHACGAHGCSTWCVQACVTGGVVSGLAVAWDAHRRGAGRLYWAAASGVALAVGAMGCACVGFSGIGGLALGFLGGSAPGLVQRLRARA